MIRSDHDLGIFFYLLAITCRLELTSADREHTYSPVGKLSFLPGEILSVQCGEKYWIQSKHRTSLEIRCKEDGKWTVDPTCRSKKTKQGHWRSSMTFCPSVCVTPFDWVGISMFFSYVPEVVCPNLKPQGVQWWSVQPTQQVTLRDKAQFGCSTYYESTIDSNEAECTRDGWSPLQFCQGTVRSICG